MLADAIMLADVIYRFDRDFHRNQLHTGRCTMLPGYCTPLHFGSNSVHTDLLELQRENSSGVLAGLSVFCCEQQPRRRLSATWLILAHPYLTGFVSNAFWQM